MPRIFEYLGILIYIYSNEHASIHAHRKYDGYESKAEFLIVNRKIVEIKIKSIKGFRKLKDFERFLEKYTVSIV